jgi:hypothetical protein
VLTQDGMMMGIYIYLRSALFTRLRVAVHHVDGLLAAALELALGPSADRHLWSTVDQKSLSPSLRHEWDQTWTAVSLVMQKIEEDAKTVRRVVNRQEPPGLELETALRVGLSYQKLRENKLLTAPTRVWRPRPWRAMTRQEMQQRLLQHCCVSELPPAAADVCYLEILGGTTAGSVLHGLGSQLITEGKVWCMASTSDTTRQQTPSTLLAIESQALFSYMRWAAFHCQQKQQQPETRYAFAPHVFQLLSEPSNKFLAWTFAVDIMRVWLGMRPLPAGEDHSIEIAHFRLTLLAMVGNEAKSDPKTTFLLIPYMLSFCDGELVFNNDKARLTSVMPALQLDRLGWIAEWYVVMEKAEQLPAIAALKFMCDNVVLSTPQPSKVSWVPKQSSGPYSSATLANQKARVKPCRFVADKGVCRCPNKERNVPLLFTLLALEQLGTASRTREVCIVQARQDTMPFLSDKDSCLHLNDFPIAWTRTEQGCQEVYIDSMFGVLDLEGDSDIPDLFYFFAARFQPMLNDSQNQDMAAYPARDIPVEFVWNQQKKKKKRQRLEEEEEEQPSKKKHRGGAGIISGKTTIIHQWEGLFGSSADLD